MRARGGQRSRRGRPGAFVAAVVVAAAALGTACVTRQREPEPDLGGEGSSLRGTTWRFRSFSDMDPIWSVASTAEHLWAATPGGLLRYPLEGGEPLRVTGEAGPGGLRTVAVAEDGEGGVWALSEGGLAQYADGAWSPSAGALPDVGALTALAVGPGEALWVGGERGLARYGDGQWSLATGSPHVTALARAADGRALWVGTDAGLLRVEPDGMVAEHDAARGLPCTAVRALAEGEEGLFAICLRPEGAVLARLAGDRWSALTARLPGGVSDLGQCGNRVLLLTELGLYRLAERPAAEPLAEGEVALAAVALPETARPRRFRATFSTAPAAGRGLGATGREPPRPFTPEPAVAEPEDPDEEPPPRPLLRPVEINVREGGRSLRCDDRGIWAGTEGLGVVRAVRRGVERSYRTMDLVIEDHPFSVAVDRHERAWLLTRDGRPGVLDGDGFSTATVEPDPTAGVRLVAFASRGLGTYALGQVSGTHAVRVYRLEDAGWSLLLSRVVDLSCGPEGAAGGGGSGGDGGPEMTLTFFEVDPRGRFWIGLSAPRAPGARPERRGVLVLDRDVEEVVHHCAEPRGPGAVAVPDDVAAVAFTRAGDAWMGGIGGAVLLRLDGSVTRYGESNGLLGEIVNDIATDARDVPWVATTAGVGRFVGGVWRFFVDTMPRGLPVTSLAIDSTGAVWGGGPRGAVSYDGVGWQVIDGSRGLLSHAIRSVHVDGRDRVWFVTEAGLSLLERDRPAAEPVR